jgi:MFS family permease
MWFGYISFGYVSDVLGRKRMYVTYLLLAAVFVLLYANSRTPWVLLALGPVVTFFGTGYFSGFGALIAELYPTSIRAAATGFTFNIGRVGSALAPLLIASFAERSGFGVAFATTSAALVLGALTWFWIPETRGRTLS